MRYFRLEWAARRLRRDDERASIAALQEEYFGALEAAKQWTPALQWMREARDIVNGLWFPNCRDRDLELVWRHLCRATDRFSKYVDTHDRRVELMHLAFERQNPGVPKWRDPGWTASPEWRAFVHEWELEHGPSL